MTLRKVALAIIAVIVAAAFTAFGDDAKTESKSAATVTVKNQTHCPVMGGKIDSTVYTDIQGHRVYHCCPACIPKIKADPDKYFKKAAADGIIFQNIQTACPVSGDSLKDKTTFCDFEGRRVYFCSDKCKSMFASKEAQFLKKLDEMTPAPKDEKKQPTGHEGHNHD